MLQHQDRNNIRTIVEVWPWLWNITQYILDNMHAEAHLTCFEINEVDFWSHLDTLYDHRLAIHYTSCENIGEYFTPWSIDLIISTIPLSLIDKNTVTNIFNNTYLCLKESWIFITGQYSTYAKSLMNNTFGNISTRRHLRNIPPVCILTSTKSSHTTL
jgi:phospholipid N-methyltransferase